MYWTCIYCGWGGKAYQCPTKDNYNKYKTRDIKKDLTQCKKTLLMCEIECGDFRDIKHKNAFYYCDPPYAKVGDVTYYGSLGRNHKEFDHIAFYNYISEIAKSNYVMISYEDSEYIRELYKNWYMVKINKKSSYYDNKEGRGKSVPTNELLITNYAINESLCNQI